MILGNGVLVKGSTLNRRAWRLERLWSRFANCGQKGRGRREERGQVVRAPGQYSVSEQGSHRKSLSVLGKDTARAVLWKGEQGEPIRGHDVRQGTRVCAINCNSQP